MNNRKEILTKAAQKTYDAIIIGGGITGAGVALDASLRGLKVLLLEKGDFASGTSSKSGKLVHGGMRYLIKGHFKLVFESCLERYKLARHIAPHIVKPTMFLVPNYTYSKLPRWMMMLGVWCYTVLAMFRNIGPTHLFSKKETLELEGKVNKEGLRGAVSFYDCRAYDSRLVIDVLKTAMERGADLLNYCEARSINLNGNIKEVIAFDSIGSSEITARSGVIINAGGAWADEIIDKAGGQEKFNLARTKGIHIIFDRKDLDVSNTLSFESPSDGRGLYLVPWYDTVLIGTTDTFHQGSYDKIESEERDIEYLLEAVNRFIPDAHLDKSRIISSFAGVRPLIGSNLNINEDDMSRDFEVLADKRGLLSISGGKLTTFRLMAKSIVDEAYRFLDKRSSRIILDVPISGGAFLADERDKYVKELSEHYKQDLEMVWMLFSRYGTNSRQILRRIADEPNLARKVSLSIDYLYAEMDYIADEEFIESVSDLLTRRTPIALFDKDNGMGIVEEMARYIGKKLGWNEKRVADDVAAYRNKIARMREGFAVVPTANSNASN